MNSPQVETSIEWTSGDEEYYQDEASETLNSARSHGIEHTDSDTESEASVPQQERSRVPQILVSPPMLPPSMLG